MEKTITENLDIPSEKSKDEAKRKQEEEKRLAEESKRKQEEEKRLAEESKRKQEEEKRSNAFKRLAEEAKRKQEEEKRLAEEAKRKPIQEITTEETDTSDTANRLDGHDSEVQQDAINGGDLATADKFLNVNLDRAQSDPKKKNKCKLIFKIHNNSYGSLYELLIRIAVEDDRGDNIKSRDLDFERNILPVGKFDVVSVVADADCKYVTKIKFKKADRGRCNLRMLPEIDDCLDIVSASSSVKNIEVMK
jgi:hypothetical protein